MSLWGIGPVYVSASIIITAVLLMIDRISQDYYRISCFQGIMTGCGFFFAISGFLIWLPAARGIDDCIRKGIMADKGVYGLVRNPIYTGLLFIITGFCLFWHSSLMLLSPLISYFLLYLLLHREDRQLKHEFGEQYFQYKKEVPGIIPGPGRLISAFFYPDKTGKIEPDIFIGKDKDVNFFFIKGNSGYICIDTGYSSCSLRREMKKLGIGIDEIKAVLLTHSDVDHRGGITLFPDIPVYLGKDEKQMINGRTRRSLFYRNHLPERSCHYVEQGDIISAGGIDIRPIPAPGHTTGHTAWLTENGQFFTGDALIIQNGFLKPFYRLFNKNHKQAKETAVDLMKKNGISTIYTSHTGHGNYKFLIDELSPKQ